MAKQQRSIKTMQAHSPQGKGQSFEHHESVDDSLLPDAAELAKLQELDPDIIPWIKTRTEIEQDARLEFNRRKMGLIESTTKEAIEIDKLIIRIAFLVVVLTLGFSGFLIYKGEILTGTVFSGISLLVIVQSFLNFKKGKNKPNEN
jgi:hypothetical protein